MKALFFSNKILHWFNLNKRALPWRETSDPYKIWISEVILQQTRVNQGMNYYFSLIGEFPDIDSLANAPEEKVLKLWQGLGYYSRARNLHQGAKQLQKNFKSEFPENLNDILTIKGIGEYTAAAIASIVFNIVVPAIDGNVYRVLSRIFGIETAIDTTKGKKEFKELAQQLIDKTKPGDYNQAVMEFGAMLCKPRNPLCNECMFTNRCFAFKNNLIEKLPAKSKKIKQQKRYFYYLIVENEKHVFLKQRTENDIWRNLFDFPLIELESEIPIEDLPHTTQWKTIFSNNPVIIVKHSKSYKHVLTHQLITARFIHISINNEKILPSYFHKIQKRNIFDLAVPKIIDNYLANL